MFYVAPGFFREALFAVDEPVIKGPCGWKQQAEILQRAQLNLCIAEFVKGIQMLFEQPLNFFDALLIQESRQ